MHANAQVQAHVHTGTYTQRWSMKGGGRLAEKCSTPRKRGWQMRDMKLLNLRKIQIKLSHVRQTGDRVPSVLGVLREWLECLAPHPANTAHSRQQAVDHNSKHRHDVAHWSPILSKGNIWPKACILCGFPGSQCSDIYCPFWVGDPTTLQKVHLNPRLETAPGTCSQSTRALGWSSDLGFLVGF